jgi:hypothetical protein
MCAVRARDLKLLQTLTARIVNKRNNSAFMNVQQLSGEFIYSGESYAQICTSEFSSSACSAADVSTDVSKWSSQ